MYNNLDLNSLSIDDIVKEYKLLHEQHQQLKKISEDDAQRIYDLKRSLDTSLAAERFLTQELEQLNSQVPTCTPTESRMQQDLEDLRRKYRNLELDHESLQQDNDTKSEEMRTLKAKLEITSRDLESSKAFKASSSHDDCTARICSMEQENAELLQKLTEYEDAKLQSIFAMGEQEKTIEILKDQVSCLEQNLRGKRDELEEKIQLLESSQEQLVDANAKIAMLSSAPENHDRKGNSLFAEVDDQRQEMKQRLASQKKSYLDMKKIFNDSQSEIYRLKRENIAMHKELEACSTIFCSADKTYQNKLNDRIRQLMLQNCKLEKDLNVSQERMRELASQQSVTWLDSMLDFCKRETDELKIQLRSLHIQKATLEDQLRKMQQEMARWRFESLKSRCVLIDRESLLSEHKITYKPIQAMEFDIKEEQIKVALPRIVSISNRATSVSSPVNITAPLNPINDIIVLDTPLKVEPPETQEQLHCKEEPTEEDPSEQLGDVAKPIMKGTPVKSRPGLIKVRNEQELVSPRNLSLRQEAQTPEHSLPTKPNRKGTPVKFAQIKMELDVEEELLDVKPQRKSTPIKPREESMGIDAIVEAKPLPKGTPVKSKLCSSEADPLQEASTNQPRSILTKKRELFAEDSQKNVQFSSSDPIVHNLSPLECTNSKENMEPATDVDIKPIKKSSCIIRRIVVPSKNAGLLQK